MLACRPVDYDVADIHDVSLPHDGLRVFHDTYRGATCYKTFGVWGDSALACVPDLWLRCDGGSCR